MLEDIGVLKRALTREKIARKAAEQILEHRSYELHLANEALKSANGNLEARIEAQTSKLKGVNDFATVLLNQLTLEEIAWAIIEHAISKLGLEDCVVYFWDEQREYLLQRAVYGTKQGPDRQIHEPIRIGAGEGIVGQVALTGTPLLVGDTSTYPGYLVDESVRLSELAVPILEGGQVIGVIDSEHSAANFFEEEHLETLTTIANLAAGKIKHAIAVEKQARFEKQLRESEARFRMIVENAAEAISELDADGLYTYVNPVFAELTGYSFAELRTQTYLELVEASQQASVAAFFQHQLLHKIPETNHEFATVSKSGEVIWVSQNTQFRFDQSGKLLGITAVARNITEKVLYTKKLQLQEEKYRNIISNMNLGLLEVDHQDVIIRANESFCKHSGYEEAEMIGKRGQDLFMTHLQDKLVIKEKNELRKEGVSDRYQMEVRTKEGELRWWLISGAPNYDTEGNQIGSIGIHLDITDHKKLEKELEKAKCKAEEYAKAKETFLANMSHEIRTPLNAIIGMLRELGKEALPLRQQNFLRGAQTGAQHLLSIISNVLDMSKIEAGELHLEQRHFNLHRIVEETVRILEFNTKEKLLQLSFELEDSIRPAFIGDPTRLRQILINIISNSIKFTHEGGICIRGWAVALSPDKQEVHLSISDTGIGMEKEYLDRLFRPFSQEDISTARQYGGTGLGMAITYELIRLMDGKILVDSQKGVGTTMDIQLPLVVGEVEETQKAAAEQDFRSLEAKAILLVEDNEMNRVVARNTLDHYGIQVSEAGNGQLALETLQDQSFDLILMDLQMPVMGGLEATRHIRDTLGISTPIIALSANAFKKEIELCLTAGMNDYVTKPYEEKVLLEAIAKHIHGQEPISTLPEETEAPPPSPPTEKLYDLSQLETISRGDEGFIQQMVDLFLEQVEASLPVLKQAMSPLDFEELYSHAHCLKPVLASMGITKIKEEVKEIERQAYEKEAEPTLPGLVENVCLFLEKVREQLNARLTADSATSS